LPTAGTEKGKALTLVDKPRWHLSGTARILAGQSDVIGDHVDGYGHFVKDAPPEKQHMRQEWVVAGTSGDTVEISVQAPRGGCIRRSIVLP
ncbi:MAG: peptidase M14, partial [Firmicutes bacterium]|nr:peptidase M14 [Bacillota bacterium]